MATLIGTTIWQIASPFNGLCFEWQLCRELTYPRLGVMMVMVVMVVISFILHHVFAYHFCDKFTINKEITLQTLILQKGYIEWNSSIFIYVRGSLLTLLHLYIFTFSRNKHKRNLCICHPDLQNVNVLWLLFFLIKTFRYSYPSPDLNLMYSILMLHKSVNM